MSQMDICKRKSNKWKPKQKIIKFSKTLFLTFLLAEERLRQEGKMLHDYLSQSGVMISVLYKSSMQIHAQIQQ